MKKRRERPTLTITIAGAHRGAEYLLHPLAAWQRESAQSALVRLVDVLPGRVQTLAREAEARGLTTEPVAARLEDLLSEGIAADKALILTLDQPASIARALWLLLEAPVYTLGYLLLRLPNQLLWGLAMSFPPGDRTSREQAARFFEALAAVMIPTGSRAILGAEGQPEHLLAEGLLRSFLGAHLQENLPPVASPLVVTEDGVMGSPLIAISQEAAAPSWQLLPHEPGSSVVLAELGDKTIRFVKVRVRHDTAAHGLTEERELTIASALRPLAMTD